MAEQSRDPTSMLALLSGALQTYQDEYKDLSEGWRQLDGKAQGSLAAAGTFLAATFAFVKSFTEQQIPSGSQPCLILAVLFLVASVVLAVLSLRMRLLPAAPYGHPLETLTTDFMAIDDVEERKARAPDFVNEQIALWRHVNEGMREESDEKGQLVLASQVVLLLAILSVAELTIALIWGWI